MATTNEYKEYVLERLDLLDDIKYRPMMGEYLLYYKDFLFGGIYDNRLLIKTSLNNGKYNLKTDIPYEKAKSMYLFCNLDDKELLKNIVIDTYNDWNLNEDL